MRGRFAKVLHVLALIYFALAGAWIIFGYAAIFWFQGFGKLAEIMSPFNLYNWIAVLLTLAPGVLLLMASERLRSD
jgi:hypothetical protein